MHCTPGRPRLPTRPAHAADVVGDGSGAAAARPQAADTARDVPTRAPYVYSSAHGERGHILGVG